MDNFGITSKLLTNNFSQFFSKLFWVVWSTPGGNKITTTNDPRQADGLLERFNCSLIFCLHYYISEHHTDLDRCLLPLVYAYDVLLHGYINTSTFSLALTWTPSGPTAAVPKRVSLASSDHTASSMYATPELIRRDVKLCKKADEKLKLVQWRYNSNYKRRDHLDQFFQVNNYVYVDRSSLYRSAAGCFTAEGFNKHLTSNKSPSRMYGVHDTTL